MNYLFSIIANDNPIYLDKYAAEFGEHGKQEPAAVEPDHSALRFQDQILLLHLPFNC